MGANVHGESGTIMKTAVWGCGEKLHEIINCFPALINRVDFFIDSNVTGFAGQKVHNCEVLRSIDSIRLVICVRSDTIRKEIYNQAIQYDVINEDNIITENQWLAEELRSDSNLQLYPKSVVLVASTLCQLNCPKCSMRTLHYGKLGAGYLKLSDFKSFLDNNPFVENIELSNYGEVLLNPELDGILEYAYNKGVKLFIRNGTNFNDIQDNVIEIMARTGVVKEINISIDGASQDTYVQYRRNGSFYKVINNIVKLNEAKERYGSEYPKLSWQYILFEHNEDDVSLAKKMAYELGMDIYFKLDWGNSFVSRNKQKLKEETGLECFNREDYKNTTGNSYLADFICRQLMFSPVINYDGRLLGCCKVINEDWKTNVFEEGLQNAVNSEKYRSGILALLEKDTEPEADSPCGKCKSKKAKGFCLDI